MGDLPRLPNLAYRHDVKKGVESYGSNDDEQVTT